MTEGEWERLESTMQWMAERQAAFEAATEANFAQAERPMARLGRFAERATKAAGRRMGKAETE